MSSSSSSFNASDRHDAELSALTGSAMPEVTAATELERSRSLTNTRHLYADYCAATSFYAASAFMHAGGQSSIVTAVSIFGGATGLMIAGEARRLRPKQTIDEHQMSWYELGKQEMASASLVFFTAMNQYRVTPKLNPTGATAAAALGLACTYAWNFAWEYNLL